MTCHRAFILIYVMFKKLLMHFMAFGAFVRGNLRFARFSTLMPANWPLMSVNVFFVGYDAPCSLMFFPQRAVEMVANGVLRTLWV